MARLAALSVVFLAVTVATPRPVAARAREPLECTGRTCDDAELLQTIRDLTDPGQIEEANLLFSKVTDAGMRHLRPMKRLSRLYLGGSGVTDAGLKHVRSLRRLTRLNVGPRTTGAGLRHLRPLKRLTWLVLSKSKITDAGLRHLRGLRRLSLLYLLQTRITDAGLRHLRTLKRLTHLSVVFTYATEAGAAKLKQFLPRCRIVVRGKQPRRSRRPRVRP